MTAQGEFKTVPHNLDAEQALLGILLFDPSAGFAAIEGSVKATDFYEGGHQLIFAALQHLVGTGKPVTGAAVFERLKGHDSFRQLNGDDDYLGTLADQAPPTTLAASYAELIADLSGRRQIIRFADLIREQAQSSSDTAERLIAMAEDQMGVLSKGMFVTDHWVDMAAIVSRVGDILAQRHPPQFVTTGYDGLDEVIGGLRLGRVTVLAGRPSMGKSAVMTAMARRIANRGFPLGIFSLEMDEDEIGLRMACDAAYDAANDNSPVYFDAQRNRISPESARLMAVGMQDMRDLPIWFDCRPGLKPSAIVTATKRLIRRIEKSGMTQKGVIIVDHLHIIAPEEEFQRSRVEQVGAISYALSQLAKKTGWALLVLAQLSRDVDSRKNIDKRPQMSDLRWAGEIEQDANSIVFIYRPEKYLREPENPNDIDAMVAYEEERARVRGVIEFLVEKSRSGPAPVKHSMKISLAHNALWEERRAA